MPIEFAYAQARAQARQGDRLTPADWRLLESSRGFSQYLHAARGTGLAPRVRHFSALTSPHAVERSLRRDWRNEVESAAHWVPRVWRSAVAATAAWPDLPGLLYLAHDGRLLPWMREDPVLAEYALADRDARERALHDFTAGELNVTGTDGEPLRSWLLRWQSLWPAAATFRPALLELTDLVQRYVDSMQHVRAQAATLLQLHEDFERRIARHMRTRLQQPVTVFCHLLLTALELRRLQSGLVRRALFNDVVAER
ncbi:MAG: hypothetical protein OEO82_07475 [Gammaproteobacteria bacterium]|nr:hypothetical protein [Gammaproteobacteria bacterium]